MKCPVLGIVGGIGSGKSLVANELVRLGGHLIPADQLGHEALKQPELKARVVERWGTEILDDQGEVDRKQLGRRVFADPKELQALEAISFPYIERRIREEIVRGQAAGVPWIVLDAAIMLETGWADVCDRIIFVDVPRPIRLERLRERRGWSAEEVMRREQAQWPMDQKREAADAVVDNAGPPEAIGLQVRALLATWGYRGAATTAALS